MSKKKPPKMLAREWNRDLENLNDAHIDVEPFEPEAPLSQSSTSASGVRVEVFFRDVKRELLSFINRFDYIVGCVAWLTDFDVLEALSTRKGVRIVVQKEDFLRPEWSDRDAFTRRLRAAYDKVPYLDRQYSMPGLPSRLSELHAEDGDAIRCVGNANIDRSPAHPRMHNKFIVGMRHSDSPDPRYREGGEFFCPGLEPAAAWTGSYNFSHTAGRSLENAVVLHDESVARYYYEEFAQILALSESLDWESWWMAPEWRIGS